MFSKITSICLHHIFIHSRFTKSNERVVQTQTDNVSLMETILQKTASHIDMYQIWKWKGKANPVAFARLRLLMNMYGRYMRPSPASDSAPSGPRSSQLCRYDGYERTETVYHQKREKWNERWEREITFTKGKANYFIQEYDSNYFCYLPNT